MLNPEFPFNDHIMEYISWRIDGKLYKNAVFFRFLVTPEGKVGCYKPEICN